MRRKRWFPVSIAIVVVLIAVTLAAYAKPSNAGTAIEETPRRDTLGLTQEGYVKAAQEALSGSDRNEDKVRTTCETFLTLARASVRDPKAYSSTSFIDKDCMDKNTIQYRLSEYQYLSALYEALGWQILWDDLVFSDFDVSIDGDHATASVVETYRYYVTNGFDSESGRRRMYNFELRNGPDGWRITNVTSSDPHESHKDFQYTPIDVESTVAARLAEIEQARLGEATSDEPETTIQEGILTELFRWDYDPGVAVSYAEDHWDDTQHPVFGFYSSNCQNFASQCVWAGLGGSGTDKTAFPAVSTAEVGTDAPNVWCCGQQTTYYSDRDYPNAWYLDWSWTAVSGFAKLLDTNTSSMIGPYGGTAYSNGVQYASVGNVLTVRWTGTPSEGTLDHAMFVTDVSGYPGQRTMQDVKIAAHTSRTTSAYQTLAEYVGSTPIQNFGRVYIYGGHYPFPQ